MSVRRKLKHSSALENFQIRGSGGSRLEALSDGVFALAIAILLLSSSVPVNFNELLLFVQDVVPFGVCILFIYWIWREQSTYFLRYGLLDARVSNLNLALLFFVLFYVYPLKFLVSWLVKYFTAIITGTLATQFKIFNEMIPFSRMPELMVIYGVGFICISATLYFMYSYALGKKESLGLDEAEILESKFTLREKRNQTLVGALSVLIALISIWLDQPIGAALAGWIYNLIWILMIFQLKRRKRELLKLQGVH